MQARSTVVVLAAAILSWLAACGGAESDAPESIWAGAAACQECHPSQWQDWRDSNHASAERELDEAVEVTATGPDGGQHQYPAIRVIGVEPLVQYLIEIDGVLQVAQRAFDPATEEWFDIFADGRQPGEWGHWTGRGMAWDSMCGRCHTTGLVKQWDPASDNYQTEFEELGVACEACHGPSADHASNPRDVRLGKAQDAVEACAPCHSRRAELTATADPHAGFLDGYAPELPDLGDTWLADGRIRDEDYEWVSFRLSRMHQAGVSCLDCHDPHSSRTKLPGNQLCMSCHVEQQGEIPPLEVSAHSNHPQASTGAQCINCHMPGTMYMQRDLRHDHSFSVPDPLLSKELGIPNACNECHGDKNIEWAISKVDEWYGDKMDRPRRHRARLLHRARMVANGSSTDPDGWQDLISWLEEEVNPMWEAILTGALAAWPEAEKVLPYLLEALGHEEELVRLQAVRALGPDLAWIFSTTGQGVDFFDPARAIRVEAGLALGPLLRAESTLVSEVVEFLEHNHDQPPGAASYSTWLIDRGQYQPAVDELARALSWDDSQPVLHEAYAAALDAAGHSEQATKRADYITRRWPEYANGWFMLALAHGANQDWVAAEQAIGSCLTLAPDFARGWYNLAIIHLEKGNREAARGACERAFGLDPNDREVGSLLRSLQ